MSGTLQENLLEIGDFLQREALARHINAMIHMDHARQESGWLHIPVHVAGVIDSNAGEFGMPETIQAGSRTVYLNGELDAYDKASILQELEDSWNDREPAPDVKLLLIPAAR